MQVRINGTANLSQAKAEFAALEAQVAGLNAQMAKSAAMPTVDPGAYRNLAGAVTAGSKAFRDSLASSGAFRVEQMRLNSVTQHYTDLLDKQKLSFKDIRKNQAVLKQAYKEQLAMQDMVVRKAQAAGGAGANMWDVATPTRFNRELDTFGKRMSWTGQMLKSAGTQMVNFGKNTQWAGRQLTVGFTMPMIAVGAAAGVMAYKVDQQMTRIRKVYDTTADQTSSRIEDMQAVQKEFNDLTAASWKTAEMAAKNYGASVTDTLGVQAELAATGERGNKLQKATSEVMKSAMLGEIDYQTATSATIALQQQLHLSSTQLADSWAYMNSVENSTSLQMKDFAQAIPIALGPIKQMGGSLQDLGTLMTAMVSRGVQVGKAANAIKALPQRLLRPSKQIQEEWKMITGTDIVKIAEENQGNIMGILKSVYEATKNLSDLDKGKAFAGLFGSYQLTTMSSMIQGMGDLEKGIGQVSTAYKIGGQAAKDWRTVSDREIKAYQQSVSGKFKIMLENLKIQAAEAGKPFVEIATTVGGAFASILDTFNKFPKALKIAIALPIAFAAIAGPVLMLVGLFYNLQGNAVRLVGSIMNLRKQMTIMTAEQRAQIKVFEQEQKTMATSEGQMKSAAFQLEVLAKATNEATRAQLAFNLAQQGVNPDRINAALGREATAQGAVAAATEKTSAALWAQHKAMEANIATEASYIMAQTRAGHLPVGTNTNPKLNRMQDRSNDLYLQAAYAENAERNLKKAEGSTAVIADNTKKGGKSMKMMGGSAGLFAGAMAASMLTSNKVVQAMANIAMTAAIAAPLFSSIAASIGIAAGPLTLIVAAVAALGYGAYKLWQYEKKRRAEIDAQNKAMMSQKNLASDILGIRPRTSVPRVIPAMGQDATTTDQATQIQKYLTSKQKSTVAGYENASETDKNTFAMQKYMQVLQSVGGTASKAEAYLTGLFMAAGMGADAAAAKAAGFRQELGSVITDTERFDIWGRTLDKSLKETVGKNVVNNAKGLGKEISQAISNGASSTDMMKGFSDQLEGRWNEVFANLSGAVKSNLARLGVDTTEELRKALENNDLASLQRNFNLSGTQALDLQTQLNTVLAEQGGHIDTLKTTEAEVVKTLVTQFNLSKDIKTMDQLRADWTFQLYGANKQNVAQLIKQKIAQEQILFSAMKGFGINQKMPALMVKQIAKQALIAAGYENATAEAMALSYATTGSLNAATDLNDKVATLGKQLSGLDRLIKISFTFNNEQVANIRRQGMEGVMGDLAIRASDTFDKKMNASLDRTQRSWDARIAANDAAAERATQKLDRKWENIHEKADARWERRKDRMTAFYDKRIDAVDAAIKAEEKAEDIRQKIFEAEKARMERLADMANKNIDFNSAINRGALDEAAKISNDMAAQQAAWALSDAANGSAAGSAARKDALENRKSALNDQKDAALKQLEKNEKAAKASLDRREKNQKAHLQKMQKVQADSLKKQQDADMASQKRRWDYERTTLDQRLALFKSYTGRNQKDLTAWMKQVGLSYDDFGLSVKGKGDRWSQWFQDSLSSHIRIAGREIANDNMWDQMGKQSLSKMLNSMGFKGMGEFRKFVKTGNLPADFGNRDLGVKPGGTGNHIQVTGPKVATVAHSGGEIGKTFNRTGVARTQKGLHPSESLTLAQKGEYLINRKQYAKHSDLVQAINSGKLDSVRNVGNGVGGATGPVDMLMAGVNKMIATGIGAALNRAFTNASAASVTGAGFAGMGGGVFGSRGFTAAQIGNAATIANVGSSMGMSRRDIEIGIMTAITESGLVNIKGGDRDSAGLFQQRPSQGWGTFEQVTDPTYAARNFFQSLKSHAERDAEAPWLAAQHVQRSAFADGSNYQKWWNEAVAIYKTGLSKTAGVFAVSSGAQGGMGGMQRASVPGKGWMNSHDYRNGLGSPLYAFDDGRIIESRAITSGGSPGNGLYKTPYRSYGETIVVQSKDGTRVRYAHLNPGTRAGIGNVKGGALIGRSGMTGNASGPHTHFEINGQEIAREWFANHGIGLNTGGFTVSDGIANLHKNEVVISPDRTADLYKGLDKFTSYMDSVRNVGNGVGGASNSASQAGISRMFGVGQQIGNADGTPGGWNAPNFGGGVSGAGTGTAGASSSARTGTFNAHTYGHSPNATIADLQKVLPRVDSIAFQEWTNAAGAAQKWLEQQGWGLYRGPTGTAVAWRKSKYTASGFGSWDLNKKYKMPKRTSQRYAVFAKLSDKQSGRSFWQTSAHLIPKAGYYRGAVSEKQRAAILAEQYQRLGMLVDRLDNSAPVVLGGDFNDRARGKVKGLTSSSNGKSIDQIYSTLKALGTSSISTKQLASDHSAMFTNYKLPGLRTGAYTMSDGMAMLHKGELVTSPEKTRELYKGIENIASNTNSEYNLHMHVNGKQFNVDQLAEVMMQKLDRREARKPQSRKG